MRRRALTTLALAVAALLVTQEIACAQVGLAVMAARKVRKNMKAEQEQQKQQELQERQKQAPGRIQAQEKDPAVENDDSAQSVEAAE